MKSLIAGILTASIITTAVPVFAAEDKPTIYIASDSTAQYYNATVQYPQTGWGQVFEDYFNDEIIVENRAVGARSTKRYDNEGRLDKILEELKPGDYFFVQFGINDGVQGHSDRYTTVEEFKRLLKERYIGETIKRGAVPVLLTASAQLSWDEEKHIFKDSRIAYGNAAREVAQETGCKFIDINRIMTDTYNSMDRDDVVSGYLICEPLESAQYPEGIDDRTHFKEKGARLVARLIAEAIPGCVPELARYLKSDQHYVDISGNAYEADINRALEMGILTCDGDCKFEPDAAITRIDFLKMAMDAAQIPGHGYRAGECLEASKDDWYRFYLQGALDKGLIPLEMTGSIIEPAVKILSEATDTKAAVTVDIMSYKCGFKHDLLITKEEMASVAISCLLCAMKEKGKERSVYVLNAPFNDEDMSPWAKPFVDVAASYGLVSGDDDEKFHPKDNVSRAQAVIVVNRIAELLK